LKNVQSWLKFDVTATLLYCKYLSKTFPFIRNKLVYDKSHQMKIIKGNEIISTALENTACTKIQ